MISKRQLAIISNCVNDDSSGESRSAKEEMAYNLFPDDVQAIREAIEQHPINVRWDGYRIATDPKDFLLSEEFGMDEPFFVPPEFIHGMVNPEFEFGKSLLGQPPSKWYHMVRERVEYVLKEYWKTI